MTPPKQSSRYRLNPKVSWLRWVAVSLLFGMIAIAETAAQASSVPIASPSEKIERSPESVLPLSSTPSQWRWIASRFAQSSSQSGSQSSSARIVMQVAHPTVQSSEAMPSTAFMTQPIQPAVMTKEQFLQQQQPRIAKLLTEELRADTLLAQADTAAQDVDALRKKMVIDPLVELRPPAYFPGSSVGVPTAFGANYGDGFVGLTLSNRRPRVNEADGSISVGFGLGDSEKAVGLETSVNIGSLRKFAANGDLGFKLHRALPGRSAIALGWDSGITWGEENGNTVSTIYGVGSKVFDLRPQDRTNPLPLTLSLGVGGGRFRSFENVVNQRGGVGVFGSVGLRVVPQAAVIASWTGQDLNLGISYVPIKRTPLYITGVVANVLNRNDNATLFSIGIGYGFNYAGYQY